MTREATKRATVYIEAPLHRALRLKSVEVEKSVSELINDALKQSLREDLEDLAAFEERKHEKGISFEEAVKKLKARGKI